MNCPVAAVMLIAEEFIEQFRNSVQSIYQGERFTLNRSRSICSFRKYSLVIPLFKRNVICYNESELRRSGIPGGRLYELSNRAA